MSAHEILAAMAAGRALIAVTWPSARVVDCWLAPLGDPDGEGDAVDPAALTTLVRAGQVERAPVTTIWDAYPHYVLTGAALATLEREP